MVLAGSLCLALLLVGQFRVRPLFLWNASPSSPMGLYAVMAPSDVRAGDMIVAWAPDQERRIANVRGYLPWPVPLVKVVAAVAGDRVCARGAIILVNERIAAKRFVRDPSGRLMPWWAGCHILGPGEFFLLSAHSPMAFDGRYFGITRRRELVGRAKLLWHA